MAEKPTIIVGIDETQRAVKLQIFFRKIRSGKTQRLGCNSAFA